MAGLTELSWLVLANNRIADLSPLLDNPGLDSGDSLSLLGNPYDAAYTLHPLPTEYLRQRQIRRNFSRCH